MFKCHLYLGILQTRPNTAAEQCRWAPLPSQLHRTLLSVRASLGWRVSRWQSVNCCFSVWRLCFGSDRHFSFYIQIYLKIKKKRERKMNPWGSCRSRRNGHPFMVGATFPVPSRQKDLVEQQPIFMAVNQKDWLFNQSCDHHKCRAGLSLH